jgi:hypothetical protein
LRNLHTTLFLFFGHLLQFISSNRLPRVSYTPSKISYLALMSPLAQSFGFNNSSSANLITTAPSMSSQLDDFEFDAPPPYRRTPPPMYLDCTEELAESVRPRPRTLRKSSAFSEMRCDGSLGLRFDTRLSAPGAFPSVRCARTPSTSTSESVSRPPRLQIIIPDPHVSYGPPSPSRPVTALYYPRSDAGDICPTPPDDSFSHHSKRLIQDGLLDQESSGSPRSPPRLPRKAYIPLPSEETPTWAVQENSLAASFEMLSLHAESSGGLHTTGRRSIMERDVQAHPVANLPQPEATDVGLLSPLPLAAPPTYQLEDSQEHISHCLHATEKVHSVSLYASATCTVII